MNKCYVANFFSILYANIVEIGQHLLKVQYNKKWTFFGPRCINSINTKFDRQV